MASKGRDLGNIVSPQTGIAITISGDPVVIGVGNTALATFQGNGRLGIGTTDPDYTVHIKSGGTLAIGKSEAEGYEVTLDANNLTFFRNSSSYINQIGDGPLVVRTGTGYSERLRIDGNTIYLGRYRGSSASVDNLPVRLVSAPYNWAGSSSDEVAEISIGPTVTSQDDGQIIFKTAHDINTGGELETRMIIESAGDVGINTDNPGYILDVHSGQSNARFYQEGPGAGVGPIVFIDRQNGSASADDTLGGIYFRGRDSGNAATNYAIVKAEIESPTAGSEKGRLEIDIYNSGTQREIARFTASGSLKVGDNNGTYLSGTAEYSEFYQTDDSIGLIVTATNGSFSQTGFGMVGWRASRSATTAYSFAGMYSGGTTDKEFDFRGNGSALSDGGFSGGGADYAEYFEWNDGNPENEDRRGMSVVLIGEKVGIATTGNSPDEIIGVVSAHPVVVGDMAWNKWKDKHVKDDFGSYIYDEHNVVEWEETTDIITSPEETDEEGNVTVPASYKTIKHSYEDWNIPEGITVPADATVITHDENGVKLAHRRVNPDYDPNVEYIPREDRQEWDAIGLVGKLRIRKGQPTGSRWIKMRDISDSVEEWLVR